MSHLPALVLGFTLLFPALAPAADYPLPAPLIGLQSPAGRAMLRGAEGQRVATELLAQFVTQQTQQFCGIASSVTVLNTLGVPAPVDPRYEPYRHFTQDNFFSPAVSAIAPPDKVDCNGLALDQLATMLRQHGVAARVVHANETSVAALRRDLRAALAQEATYVITNYKGGALGLTETEGGHFSPLAAYDAKSDRFLILDVSRYVYPPYWVKTDALYAAMNTTDADNAGHRRGYILVSRPVPCASGTAGATAQGAARC